MKRKLILHSHQIPENDWKYSIIEKRHEDYHSCLSQKLIINQSEFDIKGKRERATQIFIIFKI